MRNEVKYGLNLAIFFDLYMTEEEAARQARMQILRQNGINPYPAKSEPTQTVGNYLKNFEKLKKDLIVETLVGRIITLRKHGGLTFLTVEDGTDRIQFVIRKDGVGEEAYKFFHQTMDMGDFIQASGTAFVTRKEEKSFDVHNYKIIAKTLLPMPEKWHGLSDVEVRYRQRYLDLLANPSVRNIFKVRSVIIKTIRDFLDNKDFLEVETPVLQVIPGGANAEPFITHHNALDADLYLRIAPELYLKRCVVGGFNRVYEVARCFRNEGIDHSHNPEFTQIEGYIAYFDYEQLMDMLEGMLKEVIEAVGLDLAKVPFKEYELNFKDDWKRITFRDAMLHYANLDIESITDREMASKVAIAHGVPVETKQGLGTIIDNIYKHLVRPKIVQPTFIYDYPAQLSPLAKKKSDDPRYVEMFQLVYGGGEENMKSFSELNDPLDQEARFNEQKEARLAGDEEAQFADDDYVTALKHGLPPTAGFGIGIDRLTALLTNSHNIKEVILFPTLRPKD